MAKALFALAKYLTWRFIKPVGSWLCCESHTHAANIKFQPNACSSCFKQYFPFLLGGENIHNYFKSICQFSLFIKSIARSHCFIKPLPVLVALKILQEILSFTRSFMIHVNTRPLIGPKSKTILCYTADCSKSSCLLFVNTMSYIWMCLVLQHYSWFVLRNCHATDIALAERLGSNGF